MVCKSALRHMNALIQTHRSGSLSQQRDTRKVQTRDQQLSMNRFKTSKYKNSTPKIPKKDGWIANVRGASFSSQGKHIKSSCSLVAFNTDQAGGGMVGLSSVNAASDGKWTVTQISCHADLVTDLDFSPFDDYLLATCSADETGWIANVRGASFSSQGKHIKSSCSLVAFNTDQAGMNTVLHYQH
ncbi:coronin-7-like [Sinocyclocheilus rhinocerous]|uniref:coronin-7-like n=1 Tax=Sinocyclocheilus rhinocerous TaxID=307959 RepID=UPI0007B9C946|nr:PREDICTED: coronin-7-like [Sinocyclocheilus rhinocerous]